MLPPRGCATHRRLPPFEVARLHSLARSHPPVAAAKGETGARMRRIGGTATAKVSATGAVLVAPPGGLYDAAAKEPSPRATAVSPAADPSGATATVCQQIRSDLASRMRFAWRGAGGLSLISGGRRRRCCRRRSRGGQNSGQGARIGTYRELATPPTTRRSDGRSPCRCGRRSGRGQQRLFQRPRLALRHSGGDRQDQRCCLNPWLTPATDPSRDSA